MSKSINSLISVLIPAYNHEAYIQETIKSVINQTYQNIELIIVNDGSTDQTYNKIIEMENECKSRFVRFEIYNQDNKGTIVTHDRLRALAKGEYIAFIASDDLYASNALEILYNFLSTSAEYGLVVGINLIIDQNGKQCFWDENRHIVYERSQAKWLNFNHFISDTTNVDLNSNSFGSYEHLLKVNHVPNGYLIRKSYFDLVGDYTSEAPLEDWWLMLQLSKYSKMKCINQDLFYYRWHDHNQMKNLAPIMKKEHQTRLYEYSILATKHSDLYIDSFKKFKENYLYSLFISYNDLQCENNNQKGHIEQLIVSERNLNAEVNNRKQEIDKLKQEIDKLKQDLSIFNNEKEELLAKLKKIKSKITYKIFHAIKLI